MARGVAVVALTLAAVGCGKIGYTAVEEVVLTSRDGTSVLAGGAVTIDLEIFPVEARRPGQAFLLGTTAGWLRLGPDSDAGEQLVFVGTDGTVGPIDLRAPIDHVPTVPIELYSNARLSGDTTYDLVTGGLVPVTVGPVTYDVHEAFAVDEPLEIPIEVRDRLAGRAEALALPPEGSAFAPDLLVGLSAPIEVLRARDGLLQSFAMDGEPAGAGEKLAEMELPDPQEAYGDALHLCGTSGVLSLSPEGVFSTLAPTACDGLAFDPEKRLDPYVGFHQPLYVADADARLLRLGPDGSEEVMATGLPRGPEGLRIAVCPKDFLEATLILLGGGAAGIGDDGVVWHASGLAPWETPVEWLRELAEPEDVVFVYKRPPYRWVMLVALAGSDEVRLYRQDGSFVVLLRGVDEPVALALQGADLWVLGRARGELVRVRPR